ncbi:hypothetical protein IQ273_30280 [Nodosilinea sp. LEGE 07298]|uniref:hypothetical protein n=1 Tax=Nodosilinea sp. LEGE 07298 TaxID=2777970 RepID=UPI001882C9F4|nr:hypothetical protein [Nodosilinea sp. LEGE 07298]MBE9113665.1 hypothetical protein [Nodosilinea sp. LEGE 07298]
MTTDYVLFVHGVKNRSQEAFQQTCLGLLEGIRRSLNDSSRTLKPIFLFWGDLNVAPQQKLVQGLQASSQWQNLLFRDFRRQEIVEFVGDAALYLSRHVGAQVVYRIRDIALGPMAGASSKDRLHLVTHSMGTVILFDILFAGRWEDSRLDQDTNTHDIRQVVSQIRNALFGLGTNPGVGLPVASIHTMGSPIALFSLLSLTGESSHDLTSSLKEFLDALFVLRQGQPLPWRNFIHPGDPIAYPLEGVVPMLLQTSQTYVQMQDVITEKPGLLTRPFQQTIVPLLWGGDAHGSYWQSPTVGKTIGDALR